MMSIPRVLARLRTARRGVAAVEFALISPILVTLLGGAVDLGRGIERSIKLETAARAGAQYLQMNPLQVDPATGLFGDTKSNTVGNEIATQIAGQSTTISVTPSVCGCMNSTGNGFQDASGNAITTLRNDLCTATCTYGLAKFRTVTARRDFSPILPTSSFIPFNRLGAQSRSVTIRI